MFSRSTLSVALFSLFAAVGCASSSSSSAAPTSASSASSLGEGHGSARRFEQLDRTAMLIVRRTSDMSEARYQARVRPALPDQLARLGYSAQEVAQILTRVDEARADRERSRRWWAGLTGSDTSAQRAQR